MILPLAIWQEGLPPMPESLGTYFGLGWLMLLNSALAYVLWLWGMSRLSLNRLGLMSLLNPLTAVLAGSIVMHEGLSHQQWAGVLLVFLALLAEMLLKQRRPSLQTVS